MVDRGVKQNECKLTPLKNKNILHITNMAIGRETLYNNCMLYGMRLSTTSDKAHGPLVKFGMQ